MKSIGILTAGGDSRASMQPFVASAKALDRNMQVLGFLDGFRGLMENLHPLEQN